MTSSTKRPRPIDRAIPGVGRLTIRAKRMTTGARDELDRHVVRAAQEGYLEQLRLLKTRRVSPKEFLEAARNRTLLALCPSPALRPLVDQWLTVGDFRESSRRRFAQSWAFVFASLPSNPTLKALTNTWWPEFVAGRHVSAATLNRDRAAVLAFVNWARTLGHNIPDFLPKRRKEEPKRSDILTPDQVRAVHQCCPSDRWPFFWLLLETGARQGEGLNLRAPDISQDRDLIAFYSQPGSKSRGKERFVPVSPELANCLRTLGVISGGRRLFPFGRTTIREWWAAICTAAAIEGVTIHGMRATFITRALDAGVPPADVQKLVGHASIAQTMQYYRNPGENQRAALTAREAIGLEKLGQEPATPSVSPSAAVEPDPVDAP